MGVCMCRRKQYITQPLTLDVSGEHSSTGYGVHATGIEEKNILKYRGWQRWNLGEILKETWRSIRTATPQARVLLCSGECSMSETWLGTGFIQNTGTHSSVNVTLKTARTFTFSLLDSIQISLTQNYQVSILQNKISFHTKIPFYHYCIALESAELLGWTASDSARTFPKESSFQHLPSQQVMSYFPTYQAEVRKTSDITEVGVCLRTFYLHNHFKDKAVREKNDSGIWVLSLEVDWCYFNSRENRYLKAWHLRATKTIWKLTWLPFKKKKKQKNQTFKNSKSYR